MTAPHAQIARSSSYWITRALVLAGAVGLGLWLQAQTTEYLASIQALAQDDPKAARAELAKAFRVLAIGLFGGTGALGLTLVATCRRAIRIGQFPPPGAWGLGAARVWRGDAAQRVARVMQILAWLLVLCSLAGSALSWHAAARLLDCPVV